MNSVLPGAGDVEVILDWDPAQFGASKLSLGVRSNHDWNTSYFAPRGPGEPFHVQSSWEMTDAGHQLYSTWGLSWQVPLDGATARSGTPQEDVGLTTQAPRFLSVKIVIHRSGALPLEPAHPDHWKGTNEIQLLKNQQGWYYAGGAPPGSAAPVCFVLGCYSYMPSASPMYPRLVPQGTTTVEFTVKQDRASDPRFNWVLYYKSAETPWSQADADSKEGLKTVAPVSNDGLLAKWIIPVKPEMADPEYARYSSWWFVFDVDNRDNLWADYETHSFTGNYDVGMKMSAVAKR